MAKLWFAYEGPTPTIGEPAYDRRLDDFIKQLGLAPHQWQWLSDLDHTPRFDDQGSGLGMVAGYKHVVCEVSEAEAAKLKWKSGFYRLDINTEEVIRRLGPPAPPIPDTTIG